MSHLQFHLLDTVARDICVESETEDTRQIRYESPPDSDSEESKPKRIQHENKEYIIQLFGSTATGQSVQVDVIGFRPTFYLALPEANPRGAVDAIRTYLTCQGVPLSKLTLKQIERKKFYGFTANKLFPFLEISAPSLALFRTLKNLFLNDKSEPKTRRALSSPYKRSECPEVYEANLDPMLRFFHIQNISPCGWLQIEGGMDLVEDPTNTTWTLTAHYTDILPYQQPTTAPFKLASWDIECYSQTGDFPVAKKELAKVASTLKERKGVDETYAEAILRLVDQGILGHVRPKKTRAQLESKLQGKIYQQTVTETVELMLSPLKEILTFGDPAIQIGTTVTSNTSDKDLERHLFVWPSCEPIEGIVVHVYEDESAMIEGWFQWLVSVNPDILIGYNVFGFDERYLWDRAEDLGLVGANGAVHGLTRLIEGQVKLEEKRLSSSAMGDNFLYYWTTQGRLQIDLYHYIKRNETLPSYKLDEVTKHYLSGKVAKAEKVGELLVLTLSGAIKDLRIGRAMCLLEATGESLTDKMVIQSVEGPVVTMAWPLTETGEVLEEEQLGDAVKWVVVKDDVSPADIFRLHKGSAADRALVGKYCLQDCDLVLELYRNREVFNNSLSMANVCSVPIGYIFTRGQGIKAESLMFKACRERNTLIPVLPAPNREGPEDSYEGAIVLDPVPAFYHKHVIGVADFASLYPSSMESENISHDSLVWTKDYDASGNLIAVVFGSDDYDARPGYGYTDIEFDLLRVDPEDKRKHPDKIKAGKRVCRYAQPLDGSKATVPEIIRGLLAKRKAKRKEKAKETDPAKQALLEAEQLAYKLTANSLYGQLGSGTFKVRLQSLAASITAYGRKQIMFAKAVIETFYGPDANHPRCSANCEAKVMYGDSVTGDTPLLLQKQGEGICLRRMDELAGTWAPYHDTKESIFLEPGITVWTDKGWTPIRRVIRHRLAPTKKLFRILTHTGVADVTEDHSLILANGSEVKPSDVAVGTELLHNDQAFTQCNSDPRCDITLGEAFVMGLFVADGSSDVYQCPSGTKASWAINKADHALLEEAGGLCPFPTKILDTLASSGVYKLVPVGSIAEPARRYRQLFYNDHREKRIPESILNAPLAIVEAFWNGFYAGDGDKDAKGFVRIDQKGKEITTGLGLLAMRLGYKVSLTDRLGKQDVFRITMTKGTQRRNPIAIKKIRELPHPGPDAYVYDLETENHHFAVGPGSLIVHNTDSLFVEFALKDTSLSPRDKRQAVIDLTTEAGHLVSKALAPPHDFEFDKIFDPMLMFSKKRYAGLMFEENADDYVVKYMGIALKRRDNAPIVKTVYGSAMKKLLFERDVVGATQYVQEACRDLVQGKVKLGQLTITKSLRAEYADPLRIAHKALADRMAIRDPGNAPSSGDRIPYVYVQPLVGKSAAKLQGDRIEAPSWIKEHSLIPDYEFYLTNQIQNPVSQMFGLVLEEMPGSETVPWSKAPDNPDKLQVWRESQAAQILFDKALQLCQKSHKEAFVTKFFGSSPQESTSVKPVAAKRVMNKSPVKPKQTTLNSFMLDGFLMKTIEKTQRAKAKAKADLKNEIVVPVDGKPGITAVATKT